MFTTSIARFVRTHLTLPMALLLLGGGLTASMIGCPEDGTVPAEDQNGLDSLSQSYVGTNILFTYPGDPEQNVTVGLEDLVFSASASNAEGVKALDSVIEAEFVSCVNTPTWIIPVVWERGDSYFNNGGIGDAMTTGESLTVTVSADEIAEMMYQVYLGQGLQGYDCDPFYAELHAYADGENFHSDAQSTGEIVILIESTLDEVMTILFP